MLDTARINEVLESFLNQVTDLVGVLLLDDEGMILFQKSIVDTFDEAVISAVISIVDSTILKVKQFAKSQHSSGTLDTNDFRLFYIELGGTSPILFVIITDPYANLERIVPYAYIVADKVGTLLNSHDVPVHLPSFAIEGREITDTREMKKILLIGSPGAGKTALLDAYIHGILARGREYKPTVGVNYMFKAFQVTSEMVKKIAFFDFAGARSFARVRRHHYFNADTIMIVFDVSAEGALGEISDWYEEALHFTRHSLAVSLTFTLVGAKIDKCTDPTAMMKEAARVANQYNFSLFPTSAKTGEGLEELFMFLLSN